MPAELTGDEPSRGIDGRTMEANRTAAAATGAQGRKRTSAPRGPCGDERHFLGAAHGCALGRSAGAVSLVPDLPPALPGVDRCRGAQGGAGSLGRGLAKSRPTGPVRVLHRRHLCGGEKRGLCVGKTKRGKGTKIMAVADRSGLPVSVHVASASPHEATLVEGTLQERFVAAAPYRLIGDKAYDSDKLDARLEAQGIELIAPHRSNRVRPPTQDGRPLRRYKRRWRIERLFAWLQHFRRILSRHEYHARNFLGFVQLGCIAILMRQYF